MLSARFSVDYYYQLSFGGVKSYTWLFDCTGISAPNPLEQGSTVPLLNVLRLCLLLVTNLGQTCLIVVLMILAYTHNCMYVLHSSLRAHVHFHPHLMLITSFLG